MNALICSAFEFGALEVILEAICSYLSARALELSTAVYPALDMIMSKVTRTFYPKKNVLSIELRFVCLHLFIADYFYVCKLFTD